MTFVCDADFTRWFFLAFSVGPSVGLPIHQFFSYLRSCFPICNCLMKTLITVIPCIWPFLSLTKHLYNWLYPSVCLSANAFIWRSKPSHLIDLLGLDFFKVLFPGYDFRRAPINIDHRFTPSMRLEASKEKASLIILNHSKNTVNQSNN